MDTPYATRQWVLRNPWYKITLDSNRASPEVDETEAAPDVDEAEAMDMDANNNSRPSCSYTNKEVVPYLTRQWARRNPWFKMTEPEATPTEAAPEVELSDPGKRNQKMLKKISKFIS